jgi:aldehyde:ferredoxin oxidoreductase
MNGWMGKVLRVDLTRGDTTEVHLDADVAKD